MTDQNFATILEKGHQRNISMKLFRNLISGFRGEEFWRISPKSMCKKPPSHGGHVFRRIKISRTIFEKGHPRNNPVNFFPNQTRGFREDFLRISSSRYSAKSLPSHGGHVFRRIKISQTVFEKGHTGTILWNYFKIGPAVSEEKVFKEFFKKFNLVVMATRIFDGIKFCAEILKRTTQGTFLPSLVQIGPAV